MTERTARKTRVASVFAATAISLACGTNYAYSAWAPDFASRMRLSSTQSNLIGTIGNLGMYGAGIFVGLLVDTKGPRPGVLLGGLLLGTGNLILHRAYESGPGSVTLPWLCFAYFLSGIGGASAFYGSIKTTALNWPNHRGTATAFPIAGFGLGALFFTTISWLAFPGNTSNYLLLSAAGTFGMCYCSVFFLRIVSKDEKHDSNPLRRGQSKDGYETDRVSAELGTPPGSPKDTSFHQGRSVETLQDADETSSLISRASSSTPGDIADRHGDAKGATDDDPQIDIRNLAMLPHLQFWQLWLSLGLLTGIGLMTINNIGNDARALWSHYDDSVSPAFIREKQLMHVSILSFMSFLGRLTSGIGSDVIVKKLHASRFWCIFVSSCLFCLSQLCGVRIENPHFLGFLSGLTGLAYGFLFGVYPALVAECFGVNGLSQNWGFMTIAPIAFSNLFNLLYGRIYDLHSNILPDGRRQCTDGRSCYSNAYWVTFGGGLIGVALSLWGIRHDHVKKMRLRKAIRERNRDA